MFHDKSDGSMNSHFYAIIFNILDYFVDLMIAVGFVLVFYYLVWVIIDKVFLQKEAKRLIEKSARNLKNENVEKT